MRNRLNDNCILATPQLVSIIIPTLNEGRIIAQTLTHLLAQKGAFEIIVADGGSEDDTLEKVRQFEQVNIVYAPKGRAAQMNAGAKTALGTYLFFLHADTLPPENAIALIQNTLAQSHVSAGSFYLKFQPNSRLLRFYSQWTRLNITLLTYGDQGLFLKAATFQQIGFFKEIPLMEDVEIQQRLRKIGKFVKIQQAVTTSSRRYQQNGIVWQQLKDTALALLYFMGCSPQYLKKFYADQ